MRAALLAAAAAGCCEGRRVPVHVRRPRGRSTLHTTRAPGCACSRPLLVVGPEAVCVPVT